MAFTIPFRDDCGHVVPGGYVFLTDGPTTEEVADLMQLAFGQRAVIDTAPSRQLCGAACGEVKKVRFNWRS